MFIGIVAQRAKRYISPRLVLAAAPLRMRVQFWGLVISGVGIASVTVSARGEIVQQTNWIVYWPMTVWIVSTLVGVGYLLAKFDALKETLVKDSAVTNGRIAALEEALPSKVSDALLAAKLDTIAAQITSLHQLLAKSDRQWRDSMHGSKE